jgi:M-phase phosphoprotein-6
MEGSSSSTSKQQQLPLSGRLQGLKFMQRAKAREEALEQKQEGEVERALNESHWMLAAPGRDTRKWVLVIMEGDPKPSAPLGRMSFQNFNPAVENMVEELELRLPSLRLCCCMLQ